MARSGVNGHRALGLVVALFALVVVAACDGDETPPTAPAATASTSPTATTTGVSETPTAMATTPNGTVTPTETATPVVTPTPVAAAFDLDRVLLYPAGTRTGVAAVDGVIAAVEAGDAEALESRLAYGKVPCEGPGLLRSPACPPGVAPGTEVDAVWLPCGRNGWAARHEIPAILQSIRAHYQGLYRVMRGGAWADPTYAIGFALDPNTIPPGFEEEGQTAAPGGEPDGFFVQLDASGVTRLTFACGGGLMFYGEKDYNWTLLEPRPAPVFAQPPGTRTGEGSVDRLLAAVEADDPKAVSALMRPVMVPCAPPPGDTEPVPPWCDQDEADGTSVPALAVNACDYRSYRTTRREWTRADDYLDGSRPNGSDLYAVFRLPTDSDSPAGWPEAKYEVLYLQYPGFSQPWGSGILLDDDGIVGFVHGCDNLLASMVPDAPKYLVAPLASPAAHPLDTRTGIATVDAVLAAVEAKDPAAVARLLQHEPIACSDTPTDDLPVRPTCRDGERDSPLLDVVIHDYCVPVYERADEVTFDWVDRVTGIFAVTRTKPGRPLAVELIFMTEAVAGEGPGAESLLFGPGGLAAIGGECKDFFATSLPETRAFVLPPVGVPATAPLLYPTGTRTGIAEVDPVIAAVEAGELEPLAALLYNDGAPKGTLDQGIPVACGTSDFVERRAAGAFLQLFASRTLGLYSIVAMTTGYRLSFATPNVRVSGFEQLRLRRALPVTSVTLDVRNGRIALLRFGCGAPVEEAGWQAIVGPEHIGWVLTPLDFLADTHPTYLALAQARDEAWILYLGLRCATEAVPGGAPCPFGTGFVANVLTAVNRCTVYGDGGLRRRPEYDAGMHEAIVEPIDRACQALGELQRYGVGDNERSRRDAVAAKAALAGIPGQPPRLRAGTTVVVNTHSDDRMIVRDAPGLSSPEVTRVYNGARFEIVEDPASADGKFWWKLHTGGWAAEENLEYPAPAPIATQLYGTLTGVASVDAVIAAVEERHAAAMAKLLHPQLVPCAVKPSGGFPQPPKCREGEADGTPVEVILSLHCEGVWLRADAVRNLWADLLVGLYAVTKERLDGERTYRLFYVTNLAGKHGVEGWAVDVDDVRIRAFVPGCEGLLSILLADEPEFLLAPVE